VSLPVAAPAVQGLVDPWPGPARARWGDQLATLPGAPARARLLALVQTDPGIHKSDLCRMAGLSWGSVSHHLQVLLREGLVRVHTVGKRTLVFPPDVDECHWSALCALRDARAVAVVEALRKQPRARLGQLQEALRLDAKTVRRLLQRLEQAAIVQKHGYARPQFSLRAEAGEMPALAAATPGPEAPAGAAP
jgi:DNA-binding MarR family transcriptional regulator